MKRRKRVVAAASSSEKYRQYESLIDGGLRDNAEIALRIGISEDYVRGLKQVRTSLKPELRALFLNGALSYVRAAELAALPQYEQQQRHDEHAAGRDLPPLSKRKIVALLDAIEGTSLKSEEWREGARDALLCVLRRGRIPGISG